jgi:hypothetical protein
MAHVDPPSARSPETQKERLTQLIAQWREQAAGWRRCARAETRFTGGRTDADARAHEYSACADQLEAALAADPGQGEPPQDEEVERYLAALPWSRNAHRNGTKSTTEENIRTFVRWLRGELPGIAAPARTVQAEPAPQPATTRIVHSSEIADDPGGFEGDYVPLEDHRAAIAQVGQGSAVIAWSKQDDDLDRIACAWAFESDADFDSRPKSEAAAIYLARGVRRLLANSSSVGRETRVPHPPEPACTNCGELAKPSHYVDFVGPFCEGCWTHLKEYFAEARQETPAVPPAWQPIETAPRKGYFLTLWDNGEASAVRWTYDWTNWFSIADYVEKPNRVQGWWLPDSVLPAPPSSVSAPERTK